MGGSVPDRSLTHYGVKGMKWGVRRSDGQLDRAARRTPSDDAKNVSNIQNKAQKGGTQTLSNKELRDYLERMDLERRYSAVESQRQSEMDRGLATTQRILKVGKTVEDVRKFMETPTGKAVKKGVVGAILAAKIAVAAQTGGASAAATAAATTGAGLVLRRFNSDE